MRHGIGHRAANEILLVYLGSEYTVTSKSSDPLPNDNLVIVEDTKLNIAFLFCVTSVYNIFLWNIMYSKRKVQNNFFPNIQINGVIRP